MDSIENISKDIDVKKDLIDLHFLIPDLSEETTQQEEIMKRLDVSALNNIAKAVNVCDLLSDLNINHIIYRIGDLFVQLQFEQDIGLTTFTLGNDEELKVCLLFLVKTSAKELLNIIEIEKVASRAITILNVAKVSFSGMDLSGVRVPGADLCFGMFDHTNFSQADLTNTKFQGAWLRETNLKNVNLTNVTFGEWPYLELETDVMCCCYSTDGCWLAVASGNSIYLYETSTQGLVRTFEGPSHVTSVSFSMDGKQLASGNWDHTVRLWEVVSGGQLKILGGHKSPVTTVAFSMDGKHLASGSQDHTVRLWDVASGVQLKVLEGHIDHVCSVAFCVDGKQLASGSQDHTIRLWDVVSGVQLRVLKGHRAPVHSIAFSADGAFLASGSNDCTVRLWDIVSGVQLRVLEGHMQPVCSVAFNVDGKQLVSSSNDTTVRFWEVTNNVRLRNLEEHTNEMTSVALSIDGELLASGSMDHTVRVWNIKRGAQLQNLKGHTSSVTSVSFSPNGKQLASGSDDCTIILWEVENYSRAQILRGHTEAVMSVAFNMSMDRKLLASSSRDYTIRLWEVGSNLEPRVLKGHTEWVRSVAFSENGELLVSGGDDCTIILWNVESGEQLKVFENTDTITSVTLSSDGKFLVSGDWNSTVIFWEINDLSSNQPEVLYEHTEDVTSVVFSTDNRFLASGSNDGTLWLFDFVMQTSSLTNTRNAINAIGWAQTVQGNFLVTTHHDTSVRYWQVDNPVVGPHLHLLWTTYQAALMAENTNLEQVQGLTMLNEALLKQQGAIDEALSPSLKKPLLERIGEIKEKEPTSARPLLFSSSTTSIDTQKKEKKKVINTEITEPLQACIMLKKSLKIEEEHHGRNHPKVAGTLMSLARIYSQLNNLKKAQALAYRSHEIYTIIYGIEHADTRDCAQFLAQLSAGAAKRSKCSMM